MIKIDFQDGNQEFFILRDLYENLIISIYIYADNHLVPSDLLISVAKLLQSSDVAGLMQLMNSHSLMASISIEEA